MSHSNLKTHIGVLRRNQGLILKPDQIGYYIRNFLIKNYVENVHEKLVLDLNLLLVYSPK